MHSYSTRANTVFFYGVSVLGVLAALNCLSSFAFTHTAVVSNLEVNAVTRMQQQRYFRWKRLPVDQALFTFDLDADLTGLWNWNVHQLFVWVKATYELEGGASGESVVWDDALTTKEASVLRFRGQRLDYPLVDLEKAPVNLANANITLTLHWDVMPVVGMPWSGGSNAESSFRLPAAHCDSKSGPRCKLTNKVVRAETRAEEQAAS